MPSQSRQILTAGWLLILGEKKKERGFSGAEVEQVKSFMFLGINITGNLSWYHTSPPWLKKYRTTLLLRKLKTGGCYREWLKPSRTSLVPSTEHQRRCLHDTQRQHQPKSQYVFTALPPHYREGYFLRLQDSWTPQHSSIKEIKTKWNKPNTLQEKTPAESCFFIVPSVLYFPLCFCICHCKTTVFEGSLEEI